jgi:predicted nucleic acid-binding protein
MVVPKIYLETTVFNFPFADDAPELKRHTLKLFDEIRDGKFEPYTSEFVIQELEGTAKAEKRDQMKRLIVDNRIKLLERIEDAKQLAEKYIAEGAVKATYPTDALHIAIATVNELDFIVSLNFQHIVKRKTIEETERINSCYGYKRIRIYSPLEVIEYDEDN